MRHTAVKPRTMRLHSADLFCSVRRTFGFQAFCGCGWEGHVMRTHYDARLEASFHNCDDSSLTRGAEAS